MSTNGVQQNFRLTLDEIKALCRAGGMAPSGANAQPWRVVVSKNILELKLDPKRSESFLDVGRYASIFSLGCFAENVRITADAMGLCYKMEILDYKNIEDSFVRFLFFGRQKLVIEKQNSLYPYIQKRVTNRQIYDGTIISKINFAVLEKVVAEFDLKYKLRAVYTHEKKIKAADILGKADGIRLTNDQLFNEMMNEFRWSQEEVIKKRDGLDLKTLELPKNGEKMFLLLKNFSFARKIIPRKALERFARPLMLGCSHLCCLGVNGRPTPDKMFLAGQLVERLWLTATKLNLAIQPWTVFNFILLRATYFPRSGFKKEEETEILKMGKGFRSLYGLSKDEFPLFIFRLSKAKAPSARSLRIPLQNYTTLPFNREL